MIQVLQQAKVKKMMMQNDKEEGNNEEGDDMMMQCEFYNQSYTEVSGRVRIVTGCRVYLGIKLC